MSDCLGGWCFWDEEFKQMISTPRYVDQGKVTADVFRTDSHILEINSKSGLYPLYVAYNIYRCRVEEAKKKYGEVGSGFSKSLWDATIEENILVVCKTPMAKSITKRTLAGFRNTRVNAQYYPNLIENISERPEAVVNTFRDGKHFWHINDNQNMKLDAIVGNPPYQVIDDGNAASDAGAPIYYKFVNISKQIRPTYISMIMPSKWMVGGRSELSCFLHDMKEDVHLSFVKDYRNDRSIFPTAHNDGGICYFLWDGLKKTPEVDYTYVTMKGEAIRKNRLLKNNLSNYIIRDARIAPILEKIFILRESLSESNRFSSVVSKTRPFGLRKDIFNSPENYPNSKLSFESFDGASKVYGVKGKKGGAKRMTGYITLADVTDKYSALEKFKLFFTTTYSSDAVIPPEYIKAYKNELCTETFLLIGPFNSEIQMNNCASYMDTNFFRFLLFIGHGTMQVNQSVFSYIPLQDFTKPWTDEELYKKYNLTDDEISFIESMIKPME
jgi:hypothetical protein